MSLKILVTGATGFIGRNLAESFHEDGMHVIATGRSLKTGSELQQKGIKFIPADITDSAQLNKAFLPVDCVVHCAAKTADWGKYKDFYKVNVIGTRNLINACKDNNIKKIIFVSTPSIYFTGKDRYNILESDPVPEKQFNYGKTKLIAENELLALTKEGFQVIIFRPRAVYGKYDTTFVPRILKLAEKKSFPLINNGQALVDITYVGNFTASVKKCLSAPENAWNEVYNISNGDPIKIKTWFKTILDIFGYPFKPKNVSENTAKTVAGIMELVSLLPFGNKTPSMTRFAVGYMAKSMTMSIDKAKQKLDYMPEISNQQGFESYKKWYNSLI